MNYFDPKSAAERYAKGRPFYHPQVIDRIKSYMEIKEPFEHAIDVGCGTGLSTIALKEIANKIVGTDISSEMIAFASPDPKIKYFTAPAEELPVEDKDFELMTLSSVFHWIDRNKFFKEARRVLRSQGWMIIYDNSFSAHMVENTAFQIWFQNSYIKEYPSPARNRTVFGETDSEKEGFHFLQADKYQNTIKYSVIQLIDYLITQSNIIAVVEGGNQSIEDVRKRLTEHILPLYGELPEATFIFGGPIWYLRKV
jgi:ubiquinone/menaquinone biosynthesis C-methylase UbiE